MGFPCIGFTETAGAAGGEVRGGISGLGGVLPDPFGEAGAGAAAGGFDWVGLLPAAVWLAPEGPGTSRRLLTPVGARLGPCCTVPPETAPGFFTGMPEGAAAGFCGGVEETSAPAGLDAGRFQRQLHSLERLAYLWLALLPVPGGKDCRGFGVFRRFPVLCRDSAVGDWSIRTEGWGFFLGDFPTDLWGGFCWSLRSGVARGSRLTRRFACCGMRRCWRVVLAPLLSECPTGRRRCEYSAPPKRRPCGCWAFLRCVFGRNRCPRLALSCFRIRRSRRGCAPRMGTFAVVSAGDVLPAEAVPAVLSGAAPPFPPPIGGGEEGGVGPGAAEPLLGRLVFRLPEEGVFPPLVTARIKAQTHGRLVWFDTVSIPS